MLDAAPFTQEQIKLWGYEPVRLGEIWVSPRHIEANKLLGGTARHILLYGGSRSAKTFLFCRAIAIRAMRAEHSRHALFRHRFNAIKQSVWLDTWPKMMRLCFPGVKCGENRSDYFVTFPNGSEVWFGGLDEGERLEKILGMEFATIFLNECSQITFATREVVRTRLAQKTDLPLRLYYDENPPRKTHWTYRLFIARVHPDPPNRRLPDADNYVSLQVNPVDNRHNLDEDYLREMSNLSPRARLRFYEGEFGDAGEGALWTYEIIESNRVNEVPDLLRVVVAVDPSGTKGKEEDDRSDEVGIVVAGLGIDGHGYVLEDLTVKAPPAVWGKVVADAFQRHAADCVVGEINFGGAMVQFVVETAAREAEIEVPFVEVRASRGKVVRAEPVSSLYGKNTIHHVGVLPALEDQLCCVGGTLIETARGQVPIEQIRIGDLVMTRAGLAPVSHCGMTGHSASLVRLCTSESILKVTPCHPIFRRGEFVAARNVVASDSLHVSRKWAGMDHQSPGVGVGITAWRRGIFGMQKALCFTAKYGKRIAARFRMAITYTTETVIPATTGWPILNASAQANTSGGIQIEDGAQKTLLGEVRWSGEHGRNADRESFRVKSAANPAGRAGQLCQNIVQSDVRDARHIFEKNPVPVYNLEVADGFLPEYFANGILVHNCDFTTMGYMGSHSPDRADAVVWAITALFPRLMRTQPTAEDEKPIEVESPLAGF